LIKSSVRTPYRDCRSYLSPGQTPANAFRFQIAGGVELIQSGKEMLLRIVSMLSKSVDRFDPKQYRVQLGDAPGRGRPIEDENDNVDEDERAADG
jgi:hypothetical protein